MEGQYGRMEKKLKTALMDGIDAHRQEVRYLLEIELGKISRIDKNIQPGVVQERSWKRSPLAAFQDKTSKWQKETCLSTKPWDSRSIEVHVDDEKRKKRTKRANCTTFGTARSQEVYMHCPTIKHNYICPNDTMQRFLPYFGDKDEEENQRILNNFQPYYEYYSILRFQEQKFMMKPLLEKILVRERISIQYVIWFFMQPNVPEALVKYLPDAEDLEDLEQLWRRGMKKQTDEPDKTAALLGLCAVMKDLLNMDLWEVMMLFTPPETPEPKSAKFDEILCPYCYLFDCQNCGNHILGEEDKEGWSLKDTEDSTETCSKACYKKKRSHIYHTNWTENEMQILYSSLELLKEDEIYTCLLAKAMHKQCDEVYQKFQYVTIPIDPHGEAGLEAMHVDENSNKVSTRRSKKRKSLYFKSKKSAANGPRTNWQSGKPLDISPCDHPGDCIDPAKCQCKLYGNFCEKSCLCPPGCGRRYKGCDCSSKNNMKPCDKKTCKCFKERRECDPDLCGSCGAQNGIDQPRYDTTENLFCANVNFQRGVGKKTLIGPSGIPGGGVGLFAGEPIPKGAYIGEYVGEIISSSEALRRNSTYLQTTSYLFDVTIGLTTDAYRMGNKTRFANSHKDKTKYNTIAIYTQISGVWHNNWFALVDIPVGKELLISYGDSYWGNSGKRMTGTEREPLSSVQESHGDSGHEEDENVEAEEQDDEPSQIDDTHEESDLEFPEEADDPGDEDYDEPSSDDDHTRGRGRPPNQFSLYNAMRMKTG